MQNSIKTLGNLCTELGPPVFHANNKNHFVTNEAEENTFLAYMLFS